MKNKFNMALISLIALPIFVCLFWPSASAAIVIDDFLGQGTFEYEFNSNTFMTISSYVIIFIVAALGLNVQVGYTGQLNLGYVAFMATGAYAAAITQDLNPEFYQEFPLWGIALSLFMAILLSSVMGLLVCLPTMKLRGDYYAIVTFGFAELVRQIIRNEPVLGGAMGINDVFIVPNEMMNDFKNKFGSLFHSGEQLKAFGADAWLKYLFFAMITACVVWLVTCLRDSHHGRMLFAIRDNETAAEACGVSVSRGKLYASVISAAIGGVAGYMMVLRNSQAHPNSFVFMISIYALCCLVLGGMGSVRGTILGTIVLMSLGELLREVLTAMPAKNGVPLIAAEARIILFGLVLILMMRFKPNGISSLESDTIRLAKNKKKPGEAVYFDMKEGNHEPS